MPTLPAPYPFQPAGGDLAVSSSDDVLASLPAAIRDEATAPRRDAIVAAMTAMFLAYQERADYAAAQSDMTRATGAYERGLASDRGIFAQQDEDNEPLRDRVYATPDVVSPNALINAVNAILAPYTSTSAKMFESVTDRLFIGDGATTWHSFIGDGSADIDPQYQDRRYDLRDGAGPGGAWIFDDSYGRYFVLRVPDLTGITTSVAFVFDGTTDPDAVTHLFVSDGSPGDGAVGAFAYQGSSDAIGVYQAIVNSVERIRGHGVRWMLVVDPKLQA